MGTLSAQLLIQFYTDLFETLHMFSPWSEDVHVVWIYRCINFCHFFNFVNFVFFWPQILFYRQWVPCERNSSYNFIPILSKICTYFLHGLEMCIWFGYNPWINFCHFFHFFYFANFVIFCPQIVWMCIDSGYLVSATPYTISFLSLCNFARLFSMVWRCACGLDLILELIFVTLPLC